MPLAMDSALFQRKNINMNNNLPNVVTAVRVRPALPRLEDYFIDAIPMSNVLRFGNFQVECVSDFVFGSGMTQDQVFTTAIKTQLDSFIKGEDISIIAYGDSFSGKSHTLFGPGLHCTDSEVHYGVLPRAATYIFSKLQLLFHQTTNLMIPQCKLTMSVYEVYETGLTDLLSPNSGPFTLRMEKGLVAVNGVTEERCECSRDMINYLQVAMNNRRIINNLGVNTHPTSVMVRLTLYQTVLQGGVLKEVMSQAIFTDMACTEMTYPLYKYVNGQPVTVNSSLCILSALAKTAGGTVEDMDLLFLRENNLFLLLQDSFNGKLDTLVICCISPSSIQSESSQRNMAVLKEVNYNRVQRIGHPGPLCLSTSSDEYGLRQTNESQLSTLVSQAEALFNRLSLSKSISEDEKELLTSWLQIKRECEEESLNALSHGQLECIEEVTESEEELASSNEKMSESHLSMDNSLCESDQDDGENKICQLSDSDFFDNLDNMCIQFNSFVDTFVDSFKMKSVLTPVKERKHACSAARRGGLPDLPTMNTSQPRDGSGGESVIVFPSDQTSTPLLQCFKYPQEKTCLMLGEYKRGSLENECNTLELWHSDTPKQEEKDKRKLVQSSYRHQRETRMHSQHGGQSKEVSNIEFCVDSKAYNQTSLEDSDKNQGSDEDHTYGKQHWNVNEVDIGKRLTIEEIRIKKIREAWLKWQNQIDTLKDPVKLEKLKVLREAKNKDMFEAAGGLSIYMDLVEELVMYPEISDSTEEYNLAFCHRIRQYREARDKFNIEKNLLDAKVKDKTYSDWELRDHIMSDEMIEALDVAIEYINQLIVKKRCPLLPSLPDTPVGKLAVDKLREFSMAEIRNLLFRYFLKVVDLRETGKTMESTIAELDQKLEMSNHRITCLNVALQQIRTQSGAQMVVRYPSADTAYSNNNAPTTTLALPEGSSGNVGRLGTVIPLENLIKLQVKPTPPTKVIKTPSKLIIQKGRKKH